MLDNIENHSHPNDVHATTGPTVFTRGINQSLKERPDIPYTLFNGIEFRGYLKFKYKLGKFFLYKSKSQHWKRLQTKQDIII